MSYSVDEVSAPVLGKCQASVAGAMEQNLLDPAVKSIITIRLDIQHFPTTSVSCGRAGATNGHILVS